MSEAHHRTKKSKKKNTTNKMREANNKKNSKKKTAERTRVESDDCVVAYQIFFHHSFASYSNCTVHDIMGNNMYLIT